MAQEERKIIKIGGVPMHIVLGKTHQEWKEKYGGRCFCFFSLGDFVNILSTIRIKLEKIVG